MIVLFNLGGAVGQEYDLFSKELSGIYYNDQDARRSWSKGIEKYGKESREADSLLNAMIVADSLHVIRVTSFLDKYGWMPADSIGKMANLALFIVIQHAGIETQKKYLPMMRDAVKKGAVKPGHLALLEDRVALREGNLQIYGSQIYYNKASATPFVAPLMDPETVDERRKSVGLEPLSKYLKNWNLKWDVALYKQHLPEYLQIQKELNEQENSH